MGIFRHDCFCHRGDSALAIQQKVDDAGFPNVVVIPMGGDKVFINSTGGDDIWHVINEAIDFFGMIFSDMQKWSSKEVRYERGAWLRVYGVPVHAWNDSFFRLCVSGIGKFLHADDCTVDKVRLDFARILVSSPHIKIVNKLEEFLIDGTKFVIKLVEEWGCNLGEDVFLTDVDSESRPDDLQQPLDEDRLDEVQGEWELDALVDDLSKEWSQHDENKRGLSSSPILGSPSTAVKN
jgi:hypothetical protein